MTNNREIKFRGFHRDETGKEKVFVNDEQVKGCWVYGIYDPYRYRIGSYLRELQTEPFWHYVDPETVGQYTGLKDKNGKEIFEGDIVATDFHDKKPYLIKYGIHNYTDVGFYAKDGNYRFPMPDSLKHIIKIGNIYENPELLEVK